MRIQRALPIFLFCMLVFIQATCLAKDKLIIITDAWPPYVFQENNTASGFDYEIMMAVFSKMGYEVDFAFLPWKRCIHMVKKQKADGILDVGKNGEREEFMYFPYEHLSESSSVLFHLIDKKFIFSGLKDLKKLRVGTILGYKYNKEFLEADYFTREPVKTEEQNFQKLIHGHIDLLLTNKNVGLYTAKRMGLLDRVAFLPKPLSGGNNYLAFAKKPGYEGLAERFSNYLVEFKKSASYKSILQRYGQQ